MIDNKILEIARANEEGPIRELLDSSFQGVKRLFVLAYDNTEVNNQVSVDSLKKYFLQKVKIENSNNEIDERNFYDQPINGSIKQYNEVRKISTEQGDDYITSCLLDFSYLKLIAADLSKQKTLDADSRAIQQIIFTGKIKESVANTRVIIYYTLKQSKEIMPQFSKRTTKAL